MHQTGSEEIISSSKLIELFHRFFTKELEKETTYPFYLKEWEEFKSLLTKEPLDLSAVFQHIASVQMKIDQYKQSLATHQTDHVKEKTHYDGISIHLHPTTTTTITTHDYLKTDYSSMPSVLNTAPITDYHTYASVMTSDLRNPGLKVDVPHLLTDTSSKLSDVPGLSHETALLLSLQTHAPTVDTTHHHSKEKAYPYHLDFMKDKAKTLKHNIRRHNDSFLNKCFATLNKKAPDSGTAIGSIGFGSAGFNPLLEERTPLRKLAIYAKKPNFDNLNKEIAAFDKQMNESAKADLPHKHLLVQK